MPVDGQRAQRENEGHAVKRRSGRNRPTLRNYVGPREGHEGGEHPDCEKNQQETGGSLTRGEHQADRADGPTHHRDQGHGAQDAKDPASGRPRGTRQLGPPLRSHAQSSTAVASTSIRNPGSARAATPTHVDAGLASPEKKRLKAFPTAAAFSGR